MVEPVILELAVNGATPRHRNRHVPRTPAEITEAALGGMTLVDPGSVNLGLTSGGAVAADAAVGPHANPLADIDYMFARSGELGAAVAVVEGLGRVPASTAQARQILGLPVSRPRV
jgi:hypothetical protein